MASHIGSIPWNKGKKLSKEHREKLSLSHKGIVPSEETRLKRSLALKNRTLSDEHKEKLRQANIGKHHSEDAKRKNREKHIGKSPSPEVRRRLSEANKGLKRSREECQHLSEIHRGSLNPQWKGGISLFPYCPKFDNRLKECIREAFGRKCYLCAITEKDNGRKLDVHHCDYNKGQGCGQKWSLIPLCKKCHPKTNHSRHYYFNLLCNYWVFESDILINREVFYGGHHFF